MERAMRFARQVNFNDGDIDAVRHLYRLGRIFHELIGELANMHQAILMHADIDESAEAPSYP